ncbi:MAG: HD domain-containing protein [Fibrobacterota bacterium]
MQRQFHEILLKSEEGLSPFATRSDQTLGRVRRIDRDPFRLEFARDENRILHSPPFRRLKHKTQVFMSPNNDHICTRMEHVLHVSSIAMVMGRCLGLNLDLLSAIAKGHDLGHAPFGHAGEKALDAALKQFNKKGSFYHEVHGLRVVDCLTNYGHGLNLTYEVRDGIISHCGERFEKEIKPERGKNLSRLSEIRDRKHYPFTLEGCLVRMADKVAYLGRDLEDAIEAKLISREDLPADIREELGDSNGKIIGRLVSDIVMNSLGRDSIRVSKEVFALMKKLKDFNYKNIYYPQNYADRISHILQSLFNELIDILIRTHGGKEKGEREKLIRLSPTLAVFFDFTKNINYTPDTEDYEIVTDYIAGMTDNFALRSFNELFMPKSMV